MNKKIKKLKRKLSSEVLDVVPTYMDYSDEYRKGKEKLFLQFYKDTLPHDLSLTLKGFLSKEKEFYVTKSMKDDIEAQFLTKQLLALFQSHVERLEFCISREKELQALILAELNKEEGEYHER